MSDAELKMLIDLAEHPESLYPTHMDRYRDFRGLFLGSDQGTRVFKEIMLQGRMLTNNAAKGDPYETYLREGRRDLAITIMKLALNEPKDQPTQQVSVNPKEG